ncbi:MAG: hypothetical protein WAT39_21600 [Planctomycetota bacterium]
MNKTAANRGPEALPSFLDGNATPAADGAVDVAVAEAGDTSGGAPTPGPDAAPDAVASDPTPTPTANAPGAATVTPAAPARRCRQGATGIGLGVVVLLLALGTLLVPDLATTLTASGVPSNVLFVLGTLLLVAGATQRHIGTLQQRLDDAERQRQHDTSAVQQDLQQLVAGNATALGSEALQQVALSLQRQDEKINNLTKAIKMYGKPLMEISDQGTELAGSIAAVKTLVEGGTDALRQGLQRLESQARPGHAKELAELQKELQKLAGNRPAVDLAPLQVQLARVETALGKAVARPEDRTVAEGLQRLEQATKQFADSLARVQEGNASCLASNRESQRAMAAVSAAVAQLTTTGTVATAPSVAAPLAPTAAAPSVATAPPSPPPGNATPDGSAGYQTGTHTTGSKNVLGAIAKLKQMKG